MVPVRYSTGTHAKNLGEKMLEPYSHIFHSESRFIYNRYSNLIEKISGKILEPYSHIFHSESWIYLYPIFQFDPK